VRVCVRVCHFLIFRLEEVVLGTTGHAFQNQMFGGVLFANSTSWCLQGPGEEIDSDAAQVILFAIDIAFLKNDLQSFCACSSF
jgi:hypothetical protein